jgi:4-amino-4-deoxy-L-arabinose transferase-like glycosyltransferase
MTRTTIVHPRDPTLHAALRLAIVFAAAKLLFHFALTLWSSHLGYGYFRDEFYYIACGRHLAWGFVDHGPIVALQARLGELLFGDSVFAIRILSAAAGAAMIFLCGLITWALGGRRPAQALAMFTLLITPCYIALDGFLSMNSFESMFWMACVLAVILLLRGSSPARWWTIFGISAGIGLLNKPSMTFFLVAVGFGLLCTPERRILFTRWTALGIALLLLIALPNVLWQIHNHWPTLEFLHNGVVHQKNTVLNPLQYFGAQLLQLHPVTALLWITGLVSLLRAKSILHHRWLAIAYLLAFAIIWAGHGKDYYLAPIYPALYAAGAIAWERRFAASRSVQQNRIIAFPVLEAALLILVGLALPMASPILRPDPWVRYTSALHLKTKPSENQAESVLPQFYADRFGWQEIVTKMDAAYRSLPPAEQEHACILTDNYGEAGALDLLAPRIDPQLPAAISPHNNYWIWGPRHCSFRVVVAISGDSPADYAARYDSVQVVGHIDDPLIMPYEHKNIYIFHNRKASARVDWNEWKDFN